MRKERIINLETENQVKDFVENISEISYYIDFDNEVWKGDELKEAICNSSYDYDVFIGSYKEIEPYEFFHIEIEKAYYEYKHRKLSINYECSSYSWEFCETKEEAYASMNGAWSHLTSSEKKNRFVTVYKCYGIPEHFECLNGEAIGRASIYRGNEYISYKGVSEDIIDKIDDDISGDICPEYIVFDGVNYFYEKEIDGVHFRVEVSKAEWEVWQEIFLEHCVEIYA